MAAYLLNREMNIAEMHGMTPWTWGCRACIVVPKFQYSLF